MFDKDGVYEKVLTKYLKVSTPSFAGLYVFSEALRSVGIASVTGKDCRTLVGVSDGIVKGF